MNVGIVCEYNPLHLGHKKQLAAIRRRFGPETGIVCAMSGNFVQRGAPAMFDKTLRAAAAVECGADLVVELPLNVCLSSAEGYAAGAVAVLEKLCGAICFGCETGDAQALMAAARALLSGEFQPLLKEELARGSSFPAARQRALEKMGLPAEILRRPNDILAVEYCKAILSQGLGLEIFPIRRQGDYHADTADPQNPSATAVRELLRTGRDWKRFVPPEAAAILEGAPIHTLEAGERAILYRLRTMTEAELQSLPYGGEGLWRKLLHAREEENTLEDILTAAKSKRYTRTRLDRMVLCALLGLSRERMEAGAPWARVLAFNDRGRAILRGARDREFFPNAGQSLPGPQGDLERRAGDVYGLFAETKPEPPGAERRRRVYYQTKGEHPLL